MTTKRKIGAALAILALAILPAAAFFHHWTALFALAGAAAGTATITYQSFQDGSGPHGGYTGGTTAPTSAQSATVNAVVAQIAFGDTDTIATLTHSMGFSAAALAALQPYISWYLQTPGGATNTLAVLSFALTNSNTVTVNKVSNTGTGGTYVVIIQAASGTRYNQAG